MHMKKHPHHLHSTVSLEERAHKTFPKLMHGMQYHHDHQHETVGKTGMGVGGHSHERLHESMYGKTHK